MNRTAFFEATNLELQLPSGWFFHDEGSLNSCALSGGESIEYRACQIIGAHERRRLEENGLDPETARREANGIAYLRFCSEFDMPSPYGRCLTIKRDFKDGPEAHVHVMYCDFEDSELNLRARAHEEGHAVDAVPGGRRRLLFHMLQEGGVKLPRIDDSELFAEINAVHVLKRNGMNPKNIVDYHRRRGHRIEHCFQKAIEIYEASRLKRVFIHGAYIPTQAQ